MRKFLSIIIPRFKESEEEIFPLLSSIQGQLGIELSDIEVIISNDGCERFVNQTFLDMFHMDIRQVDLEENHGPGVARQAGLEEARGEYVMFCDADDTLHNVGVLGALIQEAEKNVPDILITSWLEEIVDERGYYRYITHENDSTWMHGKLLRRNFLIENNISFHNELRIHEDSYFLCIASSFAKNIRYIPITSYVWKYNPNSITRRNNSIYSYSSMPEFIKACSMAHLYIEKYIPHQMEYKILQFILYNYFYLHQYQWQSSEYIKYLKEAESTFVKYIHPMWHYWRNASLQTITNIYNEERIRSNYNFVEFETIWDWIERLGLQ